MTRNCGTTSRLLCNLGYIFTAMLFVAAAGAAGLISSAGAHLRNLVSSGIWGTDRYVIQEIMDIAMRMAAVFTIATSTILLRTQTMTRWLPFVGYAIGLLLLVLVGFLPWLQLLFPAWVFVLSLLVLSAHFRRHRDAASPVLTDSGDGS